MNMLDHVRLNEFLDVDSCSMLFQKESEYAHFTSAVRYPVFVNGGSNYSGNPDILRTPMLREIIDWALVEEVERLSDAVFWISMGSKPAVALKYLADQEIAHARSDS